MKDNVVWSHGVLFCFSRSGKSVQGLPIRNSECYVEVDFIIENKSSYDNCLHQQESDMFAITIYIVI